MNLRVICKSKIHHGTVNGAAAPHFQKGDCIIVAAYAVTDEAITPRMIQIDQNNQLIRDLGGHDPGVEPRPEPEAFTALDGDRTPVRSTSR